MSRALSDDRPARVSPPFLVPSGCKEGAREILFDLVRVALRERPSFRARILLAPMPVARVGRLRKWVESERPETLSPFVLDAGPEREVIQYFAKRGLYVEVVRSKDLPLSYELAVLT